MAANMLQVIKPERVTFVCVVPGCTNNDVNARNVNFHSFPATQTAQLWLAALGTEAPPSSSMGTVCSEHFRKEDYLEGQCFVGAFKDDNIHRTLKPEAVPSLFIGPSSHLDKSNPLEQIETKTTEEEDEDDYDDTDLKSPEAVTPHTRFDKAIGVFTKIFMDALNSSSNGLLDLNDFAKKINMSKRRVYDITNVLQGISVIRKPSKNLVQWVGWPPEFMDNGVRSLATEEIKLDDSIRNAKQLIQEMHEHLLNNRFAYLTYEDIQSLSMFEDQAVFVIKAPPETKLEVAHPKEAFQIHINSTKGPVEVLVCTDNMDSSSNRSQRPRFADGDYSYVPLRGLSTAAVSGKDNDNPDNSQSKTTSSSRSEQSPHLPLPLDSSPKSTSVLPTLEEQLNSSPPGPPVAICIKEEMTNLNITPDEPMNAPVHQPDQLTTDVHMTDLS